MNKDYAEEVAQVVIQHFCPEARMRFRANQSTGGPVPDFDLLYGQDLRGIVEATRSADESFLKMFATMKRKKSFPANKCQKTWFVHFNVGADLDDQDSIEDILVTLENEGFDRSRLWSDQFGQLGINFAWRIDPPDGKPQIIFELPRGGAINYGVFEDAINAVVRDNLEKFTSGNYQERHLFVLLTSKNNFSPCVMVVQYEPPKEVPSIPPQITHLWVAAITDSGNEAVVWKAENGKSWEALGKLAVPMIPENDSIRSFV